MDSLTFSGSVLKSYPAILTLPFCIGRRVVRIFITVLFPAPFGPRKEKILPFLTVKLILSTAFTSPKKYPRPFTVYDIIFQNQYIIAFSLRACLKIKLD